MPLAGGLTSLGFSTLSATVLGTPTIVGTTGMVGTAGRVAAPTAGGEVAAGGGDEDSAFPTKVPENLTQEEKELS